MQLWGDLRPERGDLSNKLIVAIASHMLRPSVGESEQEDWKHNASKYTPRMYDTTQKHWFRMVISL